MRGFAFVLVVSFAMLGSGLTLECYSCPDGSSDGCAVKQDCNQAEDSCLKLTSGEKTYTGCARYSDCDFMTLAVRYSVPDFDFTCCQSQLCNAQEKTSVQCGEAGQEGKTKGNRSCGDMGQRRDGCGSVGHSENPCPLCDMCDFKSTQYES